MFYVFYVFSPLCSPDMLFPEMVEKIKQKEQKKIKQQKRRREEDSEDEDEEEEEDESEEESEDEAPPPRKRLGNLPFVDLVLDSCVYTCLSV